MRKKLYFIEYKNQIRDTLSQQRPIIQLCFIATFVWGLIAHAYGFLNNNVSHDVLNAFVATEIEETWKFELGRFFVPVYRYIFRGAISLPWLIGLIGLFWSAIAIYLVISIFEVKEKLQIVLVSGFMITNITMISQIATYIYEYDFNAFALLMAVLSVFFWRNGCTIRNGIISSFCLVCSIGIYQSYLAVAVTVMVWVSVMDLLNEKEVKKVIYHGIYGIFIIICSGILYWFVGKVIYEVTGIVPQSRTNVFNFEEGTNIILYYLKLIKPSLHNLNSTIIHEAYPYMKLKYAILIIGILYVSSVLFIFIKKKFSVQRIAMVCLLVAVIPFAMNCIYFLARGKGIHDLMIYAVWFFYIIILLVSSWIYKQDNMKMLWRSIVKITSYTLIVWLLGQNIILSNTAYIKKEIDASATLSTMTRVMILMEQQEEYVLGETEVAFIGVGTVYGTIEGFQDVSSITGMNMNTSIPLDTSEYYYNAYKTYFQYVLNYPICICDDSTHEELKNKEEVQNMPVFPNKDCIKMIDGVLVIKMG